LPNRVFNPLRQAHRFDPGGDYVRRYVPELASVEGPAVHRPWKLPDHIRAAPDYPDPLVDHDRAASEFRHRRDGGAGKVGR
jgi:deoxyribodipyrimidine photo-lyase